MSRGVDSKQKNQSYTTTNQSYPHAYGGSPQPGFEYDQHSDSDPYTPDGQYYTPDGQHYTPDGQYCTHQQTYAWHGQASPADDDDDGDAASMCTLDERKRHAQGLALRASQHGATASKHGRSAQRGASSRHGPQAAAYFPQSEPEDPSYEDTSYCYSATAESERELQQLYRNMGAIFLGDRVLAVQSGGSLELDLGDDDAEEVPHSFEDDFYGEHYERHDRPPPELPRQRPGGPLNRRDAQKDEAVEAWRTIHIGFQGSRGPATLVALKDSGSNAGNFITMNAVKSLGLTHKIEKRLRGTRVYTGGGPVDVEGTIRLQANGNGKHSDEAFYVWKPRQGGYDVIMGAEWCYDNDALSVRDGTMGGGGGSRELRGLDMNPITWRSKEDEAEARRNAANEEQRALEAAQAETARRARKAQERQGRNRR